MHQVLKSQEGWSDVMGMVQAGEWNGFWDGFCHGFWDELLKFTSGVGK